MKEYFREDGHLTSLAFQELRDGTLDDLSRLEIAEHLSFCDDCTERYCAFLTEETLLPPPEPLFPAVKTSLRRRVRALFLNQCVRVGIAACLTLLLWLGGIFSVQVKSEDRIPVKSFSNAADTIGHKAVAVGQEITDHINEFFDQLIMKGDHHYE